MSATCQQYMEAVLPAISLQVPSAVRRDLEALTAAAGGAPVLVKEAATIAKYRLPGLAATLEVRSSYSRHRPGPAYIV